MLLGNSIIAAPTIYWATTNAFPAIQSANADGTNVRSLITSGLSVPLGIAIDETAGVMYWTDLGNGPGGDDIQRANVDGTEIETLASGLHDVSGIALDPTQGYMYWADGASHYIRRAQMDGTNVRDIFLGPSAFGIALDTAGRKIYWTAPSIQKIQRGNIDGSGLVEDLVVFPGDSQPVGLALDIASGKMYWSDINTDKIQRANLDGTEIETLATLSLDNSAEPISIALDVLGDSLYWADGVLGTISRMKLDGTKIETLISGLQGPRAITLSGLTLIPQPSTALLFSTSLLCLWNRQRTHNQRPQ